MQKLWRSWCTIIYWVLQFSGYRSNEKFFVTVTFDRNHRISISDCIQKNSQQKVRSFVDSIFESLVSGKIEFILVYTTSTKGYQDKSKIIILHGCIETFRSRFRRNTMKFVPECSNQLVLVSNTNLRSKRQEYGKDVRHYRIYVHIARVHVPDKPSKLLPEEKSFRLSIAIDTPTISHENGWLRSAS